MQVVSIGFGVALPAMNRVLVERHLPGRPVRKARVSNLACTDTTLQLYDAVVLFIEDSVRLSYLTPVVTSFIFPTC